MSKQASMSEQAIPDPPEGPTGRPVGERDRQPRSSGIIEVSKAVKKWVKDIKKANSVNNDSISFLNSKKGSVIKRMTERRKQSHDKGLKADVNFLDEEIKKMKNIWPIDVARPQEKP